MSTDRVELGRVHRILAERRAPVRATCGDVIAVTLFGLPVLPKEVAPEVTVESTKEALSYIGRVRLRREDEGGVSEDAYFVAREGGTTSLRIEMRSAQRVIRRNDIAVQIVGCR
jgi:hypothetical protein